MLPQYPIVSVRDGKLHARSAKRAKDVATLDLPPRTDYTSLRLAALEKLRSGEGDPIEMTREVARCDAAIWANAEEGRSKASMLASQVTSAAELIREQLAGMAPNGTPNNARIRKLVEQMASLSEIAMQSKEAGAVSRRAVGSGVVYKKTAAAGPAEGDVISITFKPSN
jgi:hypothetical protein